MQNLETVKRRIDNACDMQSVVNAMKVLAIVNIRLLEQSLASLDDYDRAVELGLQAIMYDQPPELERVLQDHSDGVAGAGRTIAIIFGSEQGLSGQFNERIAAFALDHLRSLGIEREDRHLITVGDHITYRLKASGEPIERQFSFNSSVRGMQKTVQSLFLYIDEARQSDDCCQVLMCHHKSLTGANNVPRLTHLYPLDPSFLVELARQPWPSRLRPVYNMEWEPLTRSLIRQYLRVIVERVFVESLLSENSSRLAAMQVAEGNIADYLDDLQHQFNEQRQSEITAEILDIVAGLEAIEKVEHRVSGAY